MQTIPFQAANETESALLINIAALLRSASEETLLSESIASRTPFNGIAFFAAKSAGLELANQAELLTNVLAIGRGKHFGDRLENLDDAIEDFVCSNDLAIPAGRMDVQDVVDYALDKLK